MNLFLWTTIKLLNILTFGYYIRTLLKSYQFILLSSISEIYNSDSTSTSKTISLSTAFMIIILLILWFTFVLFLSLQNIQIGEVNTSKFREFFHGLKSQKKSRFYTVLWMTRRVLFIISLITLIANFRILCLSLMCWIQIQNLL